PVRSKPSVTTTQEKQMKHLIAGKALLLLLLFTAVLALSGCAVPLSIAAPNADNSQPSRPGLVFVDYRDLNGGSDGVAMMDLDHDSEALGDIIQKVEIRAGVLAHHLSFIQAQSRLYTSALSGAYLYELILETNKDGIP